MAQKHLQLLRNSAVFSSYTAAYDALIAMTSYADGTPILARYTDAKNNQKTLLGVVNNGTVDIINNVSDYLLRNYTAFADTATTITANDDVKTAIAKLEKHINDVASDIEVNVVRDENSDNTKDHLTVTANKTATGDTFTLTLNDVASASALTQEISNREAGDNALDARLGNGVTSANTATAQLTALSGNNSSTSAETSVEGAKRYADAVLDGALDALDYNLVSGASAAVVHINQTDGAVSAASVNVDTLLISDYAEGSDAKLANTDSIAEAFGKVQGQINAMDLAVVSGAGEVITAVSEADGKVSANKTPIKDVVLTNYSKDTGATGAISSSDDVEAALSKIENNIEAAKKATTVASADNSITVTTGANGTDIAVNIKSGEHVLAKNGNAGVYTDIKLSGITPSSTTIKEEYALIGTDGTKLGESVKIYKDSSLVSMELISGGTAAAPKQYLRYVYVNNSGDTAFTDVDVSLLLAENEFKSGVTVDASGIAHGVVDPQSEAFLTVGADGFKLSGVQSAITTAIDALDYADTAVTGQYVSEVDEANGVISVQRANVSEATMNNYQKGSDSTAVAATDTLNQAISKLENQVDKAKAAATTEVVEGTDAGNNLSITTGTAVDGHVIYTVNLADVASASALTDEISYRKAVDGVNGNAYTADTNAHYISGASNLYTADQALDTALYNESTARTAAIQALDAEVSGGTGHVNVTVTEVDGVITDVAVAENDIASETELYALSAKSITTAVMTGGTVTYNGSNADGTKQLTINTDGSQIYLTNYTGTDTGTPAANDTVNAAIAKLYNKIDAGEVEAGSATTVVATSTGQKVDVKLDTTSSINDYDATHGQYAHDTSKNVLEITENGLYLNNNWDCGTY